MHQQQHNKDDEPKINDDVTMQQFLMKISRPKLPTQNFFRERARDFFLLSPSTLLLPLQPIRSLSLSRP